jgi:AcrR family transcriptional regulator
VTTHSSSNPGRPRSTAADRAILKAAIKLLRAHGYAGMSVEAVAAEAGVGKATIYRRYRNKGELVIASFDTFVQRPDVPDSGSTRDDFESVLRHFHTRVIAKLGMPMLGTLMVQEEHHPEFISSFRRRVIEPRREVLRVILREGIDRGEVRKDVDVEMCVDFLTGGLMIRRLASGRVARGSATRAVDALWAGIAVDP